MSFRGKTDRSETFEELLKSIHNQEERAERRKLTPTEILRELLKSNMKFDMPVAIEVYGVAGGTSVYSAPFEQVPPSWSEVEDHPSRWTTVSTAGTFTVKNLPRISKLKEEIEDWLLNEQEYPDTLVEILPTECFDDLSIMEPDDANQIIEIAIVAVLNWILRK